MDKHLGEAKDAHLELTLARLRTKCSDLSIEMEATKIAELSIFKSFMVHGRQYAIGELIDAKDKHSNWFVASILEIGEEAVKVHYLGCKQILTRARCVLVPGIQSMSCRPRLNMPFRDVKDGRQEGYCVLEKSKCRETHP